MTKTKVKKTKSNPQTRSVTDDDIYAGAAIRRARVMKGVSQEALANAIGLTFQQVQKYERGANRVSVGKLCEIARAFELTVDFFLPKDVQKMSQRGTAKQLNELAVTVQELQGKLDQICEISKLPSRIS